MRNRVINSVKASCINGLSRGAANEDSVMDSRSGTVFCQDCCDFIYDHDLERLLMDPSICSLKCRCVNSFLCLHLLTSPTAVKRHNFDNSETENDIAYVGTNANKRACGKAGVRGLYNLGQTCYMNVILQTMLHDPLLTAFFLGNGHQPHDCSKPNCVTCAVSEAFAEFNNEDKVEGFGAANLLMSSWRAGPVSLLTFSHLHMGLRALQ